MCFSVYATRIISFLLMNRLKYPRHARLKSRKLIGQLFSSRQSVGAFPLRFFWMQVPKDAFPLKTKAGGYSALQVGFSVPKKKFKHAVDRNRIKRLIKEAYRLQQTALIELLNQKDFAIVGMWIYVSPDMLDFKTAQKAVAKGIQKLTREL